jgi:Family of unknown function (DUF6445)
VFSENVKVTAAPLFDDVYAFVIDDALADPDALVQFAKTAKSAFKHSPADSFPGVELRMADSFSAKFEDFFRRHLRRYFDARRIVATHTRLSLHTCPADELRPLQWLPTRESVTPSRDHSVVAATLYLFNEPGFDGTGFYLPKKTWQDTLRLYEESRSLGAQIFSDKYRIKPGYMTQGDDYFQLVQAVPAKRNRLVVYDGAMFHATTISAPEKLTTDANSGLLAMNATIVCRRHSDGFANRWQR